MQSTNDVSDVCQYKKKAKNSDLFPMSLKRKKEKENLPANPNNLHILEKQMHVNIRNETIKYLKMKNTYMNIFKTITLTYKKAKTVYMFQSKIQKWDKLQLHLRASR